MKRRTVGESRHHRDRDAGRPAAPVASDPVMASTPTQMTIGEFCKGVSKDYLQQSRKAGFAILTLDKKTLAGKALWTHLKRKGRNTRYTNNRVDVPLQYVFRNQHGPLSGSEGNDGRAPLPLASIAASAILTKIAKRAAAQNAGAKRAFAIRKNLFDRLDSQIFVIH